MATTKKAVKKAAPKKAAKKVAAKKQPDYLSQFFSKKTVTLFNKACNALKLNPDTVIPKFTGAPAEHVKSWIAWPMLTIIIEHVNKLNNNWEPDYHTKNQKWYTYHWAVKADKNRPSGFGLSVAYSDYDFSLSSVGSRLYFGSREDCVKYAPILEELYIAYKL
jgi:hypothetical protein